MNIVEASQYRTDRGRIAMKHNTGTTNHRHVTVIGVDVDVDVEEITLPTDRLIVDDPIVAYDSDGSPIHASDLHRCDI